jgi:hypothetical protein
LLQRLRWRRHSAYAYAPAACYDRYLCNLSSRFICCLNGDICRWCKGRRVSLKNIVNDLCIAHPRFKYHTLRLSMALTFTIPPIGYTLLPLPLITVSLLVVCGINVGGV